jgi:hypothetical protein
LGEELLRILQRAFQHDRFIPLGLSPGV